MEVLADFFRKTGWINVDLRGKNLFLRLCPFGRNSGHGSRSKSERKNTKTTYPFTFMKIYKYRHRRALI